MSDLDKIFQSLKDEYKNYEIYYIKKLQKEEKVNIKKTINEKNNIQYELYLNELLNMDFLKLKKITNDEISKNTIDDYIIQYMIMLSTFPKNLEIDEDKIKKIENLPIKEIKSEILKTKRIKLHETFEKIVHILDTFDFLDEKTEDMKIINNELLDTINKLDDESFQEFLSFKYDFLEKEIEDLKKEIDIKSKKISEYIYKKQLKQLEFKK